MNSMQHEVSELQMVMWGVEFLRKDDSRGEKNIHNYIHFVDSL